MPEPSRRRALPRINESPSHHSERSSNTSGRRAPLRPPFVYSEPSNEAPKFLALNLHLHLTAVLQPSDSTFVSTALRTSSASRVSSIGINYIPRGFLSQRWGAGRLQALTSMHCIDASHKKQQKYVLLKLLLDLDEDAAPAPVLRSFTSRPVIASRARYHRSSKSPTHRSTGPSRSTARR